MKKQISPKIISLIFGILVICFVVVFYVLGWTEPTAVPPGGNVPAPINVGSIAQTKAGSLTVATDDGTSLRIGSGAFQLAKDGLSLAFRNNAGTTRMIIGDDGNVGIGTTTPDAKLTVIGNVRISGLANPCDTIDTNAQGDLICGTDAANNIVFNTNNAQGSLSLVLPTGTWTVVAHFWGRSGNLPAVNLRIDGTTVAASSNMPDQTGTDTVSLMGAKGSVAGGRTIVIDYTTSGGGAVRDDLRGLFAFALQTN